MSVWEIVGGVLITLISLAIVAMVLFQESPKGSGMSALSGGDSYFNKNQGRSLDAVLSRFTKILAIAFFILVILANMIPRFF